MSAGLAERPRHRRLAGLREGLLCAGDVAAPLLRVGDPLGGAFGEGMEQLLLSALKGLQGRAREELGRLRILAVDDGCPGQLEVPLRGQGVDPRLAGLPHADLRAGDVRLHAGPLAGDVDGPLRSPCEFQRAAVVPRPAVLLRGLEDPLTPSAASARRAASSAMRAWPSPARATGTCAIGVPHAGQASAPSLRGLSHIVHVGIGNSRGMAWKRAGTGAKEDQVV